MWQKVWSHCSVWRDSVGLPRPYDFTNTQAVYVKISLRFSWHGCALPDMGVLCLIWLCSAWYGCALPDIAVLCLTWVCSAWHGCALPDMAVLCLTWVCSAWHGCALPDMAVLCLTWLCSAWHDCALPECCYYRCCRLANNSHLTHDVSHKEIPSVSSLKVS